MFSSFPHWISSIYYRLRNFILRNLIRITEWGVQGNNIIEKLAYNLSQKTLKVLFPTGEKTDANGNIFLLSPENVIDRQIILKGVWEPHSTEWLKYYIHKGDTFYDIGANIGYQSLLASRLVGENGNVIAFEPNSAIARS